MVKKEETNIKERIRRRRNCKGKVRRQVKKGEEVLLKNGQQ